MPLRTRLAHCTFRCLNMFMRSMPICAFWHIDSYINTVLYMEKSDHNGGVKGPLCHIVLLTQNRPQRFMLLAVEAALYVLHMLRD